MVRRVVVVAAGVDVLFFVLFHALGSPLLAWLNLLSIAIYAVAYWLLSRRINRPAIALIWFEVLGHAAVGTWLIGWDSGFHYYLLMFIPAIVVSASLRWAVALVLALLAFYVGLEALSRAAGPLRPLSPGGVQIVEWFNIAIVFAMFAGLARLYVELVRRAEQRLHLIATRDPLTGLFNRRHFQSLADHVAAHGRRTAELVSLVMGDVDFFKHINDSRGHDVGDKVLVHIAEVLERVCRDQDIIARWGGEEFLVLLPDTDAGGAISAAERMRRAIEASTLVLPDRSEIRCTMSFGSTMLRGEEPVAEAVARADRAMYRSKADGRNRVTSD